MMLSKLFRLTVCVLACFCMSGYASGQDILKKDISLQAKNIPLEQLLDQIEQESGCVFAYPIDIVDVDRLVTIDVTAEPVEDVLKQVLADDLNFKQRGSYIIIQQKRQPQTRKKQYAMSGKLIDAKSGKQISNASIYEVNNLKATMSKSDGTYALKVKDKTEYVDVLVSKENYRDTLIRVRQSEIKDLVVALQPLDDSVALVNEPTALDTQTVVQMLVSDKTYLHASNLQLKNHSFGQVSFLPALGTNRNLDGVTANNVSFNLLAGYAHSLNGLEVGGFANITRFHVNGIQFAGFMNFVGGRTNGIQVAGFSNFNNLSLRGVQVSGFANSSRGRIQGIQVSGFSNMAARMDGIQVSGFMNSAWTKSHVGQFAGFLNIGRDNNGGQVAGFLNVSTKKINGGQIAGFGNYASTISGAQISGLFNVALRKVDGVQIAGLLNYATKLNGVQIGLINVCDSLNSGISIGLLNIVRTGLFDLQLHRSNTIPVNLVFKTGSNKLYNLISAGYHFDEEVYAFGYGLGSRHIFKSGFVIGGEVQSNFLYKKSYTTQVFNLLNQAIPYIGYQWGKEVIFSLGPEINLYYSRLDTETGQYGFSIIQNALYEEFVDDAVVQGSIGYRFGISF